MPRGSKGANRGHGVRSMLDLDGSTGSTPLPRTVSTFPRSRSSALTSSGQCATNPVVGRSLVLRGRRTGALGNVPHKSCLSRLRRAVGFTPRFSWGPVPLRSSRLFWVPLTREVLGPCDGQLNLRGSQGILPLGRKRSRVDDYRDWDPGAPDDAMGGAARVSKLP